MHNIRDTGTTARVMTMIECRTLRITLVSAQNLPDVRSLGRMKVYAETMLNDESGTAMRTTADMEGETNPRWNTCCEYTISESCVQDSESHVAVRLHCERTIGDKFICGVKIPIKALFDAGVKSDYVISYNLPGIGDGNSKLNFCYSLSDMFLAPKPSSNWKMKAAAVMVRGTWFLLTGDTSAWS